MTLQEFLDQFQTADQIADECRRRGVKGWRGTCSRCPLANLLRSEFGCIYPSVGLARVNLCDVGGAVVDSCSTSRVARQFAVRIDCGHTEYADLIGDYAP